MANVSRLIDITDLDPWKAIGEFNIADLDEVFTDLAANWYRLAKMVGIIAVAISFIVIIIRLVTIGGKNPQKLAEIKADFLLRSIIMVVISAFPWFVGTVYQIAKTFANI